MEHFRTQVRIPMVSRRFMVLGQNLEFFSRKNQSKNMFDQILYRFHFQACMHFFLHKFNAYQNQYYFKEAKRTTRLDHLLLSAKLRFNFDLCSVVAHLPDLVRINKDMMMFPFNQKQEYITQMQHYKDYFFSWRITHQLCYLVRVNFLGRQAFQVHLPCSQNFLHALVV